MGTRRSAHRLPVAASRVAVSPPFHKSSVTRPWMRRSDMPTDG